MEIVAGEEKKVSISILEGELTMAIQWLIGNMKCGAYYKDGMLVSEVEKFFSQYAERKVCRQELIDAVMTAKGVSVSYTRMGLGFFKKEQ